MRPVLVGILVLALLGVVAAASRSDRPSRPADADTRSLPIEFWDYAVTLGLVVTVGVLVMAVVLKVPVQKRKQGRFGLSQFGALAVICALAALAGTRMQFPEVVDVGGVEDAIVPGEAEVSPQAEESTSAEGTPRAARFQWGVIFALGALAALGVAFYLVRRRFAPKGGGCRRLPRCRRRSTSRSTTCAPSGTHAAP